MSIFIYGTGALLAFINGALSFYFYAVYRNWIDPNQYWVPAFCRMDSNSCTSIVDTPYGRLFKIPNTVLGIVGMPLYGIAIMMAGLDIIPLVIPLVAGGITVAVGIYLIYGLLELKTACPLCLTVHFINLLILALQLAMIV